jgi:hypothetical protein
MKLVSFDVGIRNLAFCILDGTSRKDVKILHWDLIDVLCESTTETNCFKCNSSACWAKQDNSQYACSKHKPKTNMVITKSSLQRKSITELREEFKIDCKTKSETVNEIYKAYKKDTWKRCMKSCKFVPVVDLARPLMNCLEQRMDMWKDTDLVVIEQQIDKKMIAVQTMIHMWFICKGFQCMPISATHKLTNVSTVDDATGTYKGRKKTGIIHTKAILLDETLKTFFTRHPKKDDLADCFLQGLWKLENNK